MVDDNNISVFNKFVAEALSKLYSKFPRQVDFRLEEFDYLNNETNRDIFFSSINFLKKENFISLEQQVYGSFVGVVLTAKALDLLNSTPFALSKSANFSSKIKEALQKGKAEAINTVIKEFMKLSVSVISKKIRDE